MESNAHDEDEPGFSRRFWGIEHLDEEMARNMEILGLFKANSIQIRISTWLNNTDGPDIVLEAPCSSDRTFGVAVAVCLQTLQTLNMRRSKRATEEPDAIILCPTHETAIQTFSFLSFISNNTPVIPALAVENGSRILKKGHIIVATMAGLLELAEKRKLAPTALFVVDEATTILTVETTDSYHQLRDYHVFGNKTRFLFASTSTFSDENYHILTYVMGTMGSPQSCGRMVYIGNGGIPRRWGFMQT